MLLTLAQIGVFISAMVACILPATFAVYLFPDKKGIGRVMAWMFISTFIDMAIVADFAWNSVTGTYNTMSPWQTILLRGVMIGFAIFANVNAYKYVKRMVKQAQRRDRRAGDKVVH